MAADSSMGFHQGITAASVYNHHHHHNMLSFQSSSSDISMGGGAGMGLVSMSEPSSTAGLYHSSNNSSSSNNNNNGVFGNVPVVVQLRSSPGGASHGGGTTASKYKFVTGSPSEWSDRELNILNEGLTRYAREPNIMRYIKIAAMLPNRTIRDVALRCWWAAGKDRRKKPEGFFTGKKMRDMKPMQDKMFASAPMANFHMAPTNNLTPFSISMQNPNQQCQVPKEAPVVDSATQQLLEENNQLLNQIASNIETFKTGESMDLFLRTNSNIKTILSRMSETPGIRPNLRRSPARFLRRRPADCRDSGRGMRVGPCVVMRRSDVCPGACRSRQRRRDSHPQRGCCGLPARKDRPVCEGGLVCRQEETAKSMIGGSRAGCGGYHLGGFPRRGWLGRRRRGGVGGAATAPGQERSNCRGWLRDGRRPRSSPASGMKPRFIPPIHNCFISSLSSNDTNKHKHACLWLCMLYRGMQFLPSFYGCS